MSFYDFLIIYLACGAPLGVYYFLQNRRTERKQYLWLFAALTFLFWIPFAFRIVSQNKTLVNIFAGRENSDADYEKQLAPLRKSLETAITENIPQLSVFEVREILERYVGLTAALQVQENFAPAENEFYKISGRKNARLAAICFARRNRQRFFFHQTEARKDFLKLIGTAKNKKLLRQTIEFVTFLKDYEAQAALEKIAQTEKSESVNKTEKVIWKSETHKPLPINQTASARLKLSPATMNLRAKD